MKSKLPIIAIFLLVLIAGVALYFAYNKKSSSESYSTCMSYNTNKMNGKRFLLFEWPGAIDNGKVDGNGILLKFEKDIFYFSDNKDYKPMEGDDSPFKYHITANQHNIVSGYDVMTNKNPPLWQTFSYFEETGILVLVGRNAMTLTFVDIEKFPYYFYSVNKDNTVDVYCNSGKVNKYTNYDKDKTTIYDLKSAC